MPRALSVLADRGGEDHLAYGQVDLVAVFVVWTFEPIAKTFDFFRCSILAGDGILRPVDFCEHEDHR